MEASQRSKQQTWPANNAQKTQVTGGVCSHPKKVLQCALKPATPLVQVRLIRDASAPKRKITCAREVVALCKDMKTLDREHFRALYLDSRHGLLGTEAGGGRRPHAPGTSPREV